VIVLLLLACAQPTPTWTEVGAYEGAHARLDADHDGRVTKPEWDDRVWNGPYFWSADADGDGDVSASELRSLARIQLAHGFDGAPASGAGAVDVGPVRPTGDARDAWEVLVWMSDALRARGVAGLDPATVAAVVDAGGLETPVGAAALAALRTPWEAEGWAWPFDAPAAATPAPSPPASPPAPRAPSLDEPPAPPALAGADPGATVAQAVRARFDASMNARFVPGQSPPGAGSGTQ
jgi:hypothetical protein